MVTDTVVTGRSAVDNAPDLALLTDATEERMPVNEETTSLESGGSEKEMSINPMQKAHAAPRCTAKSKRTGKPCRSPAVRGFRVCRMHGARGGAPEGKRNGNYRHGARSKETIALWRLIKNPPVNGQVAEHRPSGGFAPGHKKVGGRRKGTPNKLPADIRRWVEEAAAKIGYDGQGGGGGPRFVERTGREYPPALLHALLKLLPRDGPGKSAEVLGPMIELTIVSVPHDAYVTPDGGYADRETAGELWRAHRAAKAAAELPAVPTAPPVLRVLSSDDDTA